MKIKVRRKSDSNFVYIIAGLALILVVSSMDGFTFSFVNAILHIVSDLTADIKIHMYIAGLVLLIYGLYKRSRSWQRK